MTLRTYSVEDYGIADMFANNLVATLEKAACQPSIVSTIDNAEWLIPINVIPCSKIYFLAWMDLYKCLRELGHDYQCDKPESLPLLLLYVKTATDDYVSYDNMDEIVLKYGRVTEQLFSKFSKMPIIKISQNSFFTVADLLGRAGVFSKISRQFIIDLTKKVATFLK